MITLMTKYAVIVGLTLAFTAATCSVARSRAGAEQIGHATRYLITEQLAQYCVPSESTDMLRLFCGRDEA